MKKPIVLAVTAVTVLLTAGVTAAIGTGKLSLPSQDAEVIQQAPEPAVTGESVKL